MRGRLVVLGLRRGKVKTLGIHILRVLQKRAAPETAAEAVEQLGARNEVPAFVITESRIISQSIGAGRLSVHVSDVLKKRQRLVVLPLIGVFDGRLILQVAVVALEDLAVSAARGGRHARQHDQSFVYVDSHLQFIKD